MTETTSIQEKIEARFETAKTNARKGYLAYLGLIGKAFEQSQDTVEDLNAKRDELQGKIEELFSTLVTRGEGVQGDLQSKYDELTAEQKAKFEEQKAALEERLQPVLDRIEELKARISGEEISGEEKAAA